MKKFVSIMIAALLAMSLFAGCATNQDSSGTDEASQQPASSDEAEGSFDADNEIMVVSREDGSGTRGAFVELLGIEQEDEEGNTVDMTTLDATIASSTSVVMTTVAGNPYAIGYISLGSLDETVKALTVDGTEATVENIKDGSYKISRPFNIAVKKDGASELAQDFISFIMSEEGQAVIEEEGYISIADDAQPYAGSAPAGKIVVGGSSSVTPVMEKLKEAYAAVNPDAEIEVQQTDSSTGMSSATEGVYDIGMASRDLKDSELETLTPTVIAMDGIAVVVNNENSMTDIAMEDITSIFTGEITNWADVVK